MLELIRLYLSILLHPEKKLGLRTRCRILAVGKRPDVIPFARYISEAGGGIESVDSIDAISWKAVFFRSVRVLNVPGKKRLAASSQRIKRKLLKWLFLDLNRQGFLYAFQEVVFHAEPREKIIVTPVEAISRLFACHQPGCRTLELEAPERSWRFGFLMFAARRNLGKIEDPSEGLTVFVNISNPTLLRTYHLVHPNRRVVLRLVDWLGERPEREVSEKRAALQGLLKGHVIDGAETYCRRDAGRLGILYRPNGVDPGVMGSLRRSDRDALYCFFGSVSQKGGANARLRDLAQVKKEMLRLYPKASPWIREEMTDVFAKTWVSYRDYLTLTSGSEVCVDLVRESQGEGLSYRIPEALFLNQKIITNRLVVRDEPFYDPDRVFLIGVDPLPRLQSFLEKEIEPLREDVLKHYDASLWWTDRDPYGTTDAVETTCLS